MGALSGWLQKRRTGLLGDYIEGDVLEIGCGSAITLDMYDSKIKGYVGIEYSADDVKKLKKKYPQAKFFQRDLDTDQLHLNKKFDTIISLAVMEHIFNQKFSFEELLKHLKPDGRIIITTPTPLGNDIVHRLGSRLGLFDREHHDDHIVIYNKERFGVLAQEFNAKIEKYKKFQLGCNQLVVIAKK